MRHDGLAVRVETQWPLIVIGLFAIALPVQMTVMVSGTPLRLALSDGLILLSSPLALLLAWSMRAAVAKAPFPPWLAMLALATMLMILMTTVLAGQGALTGWALGKFVGWFVLLAYGGFGLLLALARPAAAGDAFTWPFICGLVITILADMLLILPKEYSWLIDARLSGFSGNPNAFGLMLLCGLAFILSRDSAGWRENIIAAGLCAAIVLTRSVAAALALAALIACYTVLSRRLNRLVPIAATTATMVALAIFANNAEDSARRHDHFLWDKVSVIVVKDHAANEHLFGSGLSSRIASAKRAIDLWSEHPILGIGLGRFYAGDGARAPSNHPSMIIHNTPLWLLVEFGIVGLAVFAGLFMTFGVWLYYTHGVTGLLILSAWATMALFHELLYQRTPWFALGLCAGIVLSRAPHASPRDAA